MDFKKNTLPICALTSLCTLLVIATGRDMEIKQLGVNLTFLYSDLDKEIYLEQLEGFEIDGNDGKRLICRLYKAIYRLKQVRRVW